jgi:hypothetical protein
MGTYQTSGGASGPARGLRLSGAVTPDPVLTRGTPPQTRGLPASKPGLTLALMTCDQYRLGAEITGLGLTGPVDDVAD